MCAESNKLQYIYNGKVAANDICIPTARDKYTTTQK